MENAGNAVNLLKPWIEPVSNPTLYATASVPLVWPPFGVDLYRAQWQELEELYNQHLDKFSEHPRQTHVLQYDIKTLHGVTIRQWLYQVPEVKLSRQKQTGCSRMERII